MSLEKRSMKAGVAEEASSNVKTGQLATMITESSDPTSPRSPGGSGSSRRA